MQTETETRAAPATEPAFNAPEPTFQEDSLEFMYRGVASPAAHTGVAVLEVGQIWGQTVLDVQHFANGAAPVTLSASAEPRPSATARSTRCSGARDAQATLSPSPTATATRS